MTNPITLKDETIIVTGAGQGIGLALSRYAISLGANVIGVDLNPEALEAAAGELGGNFFPEQGGVSDPEVARRVVANGVERFGKIHGLINNAGITRTAMIDKMSFDSWTQVIDVHLTGSFLFTQELCRHFIQRSKGGDKSGGAIVNISSDAGRRGSIGQINYSTAKSGMFGMTMSTAREMAKHNVRANAICFGTVETEMTTKVRTDEKLSDFYLAQTPLGRWASPEEVSVPVVFLLTPGASYITGQILSVNGGYTIAV